LLFAPDAPSIAPASTAGRSLRETDVLATVGSLVLGVLVLHELVLFWHLLPGSMFDYDIFRKAGSAVLNGHSPWHVEGFIYPATAAVAFVPFGAVSFAIGGFIFALLIIGALVAALWILGVRDWRCYAIAFLATPGEMSVITGTLSGVCALLAAVIYRYRDGRARPAAALAVALATKLFLWPLGVWLIATRRARSAVIAVGTMVLFLALSWLVMGSSSFASYRDSISPARQLAEASYSPFALARAFGASPALATALIGLIGLAILAAARFIEDERITFSLALLAALVLSPVVWIHYLVLLYVPIAIARPRLSALWFAPALYAPIGLKAHADGSLIRIGLVLAVTSLIFWLIIRAGERTAVAS
jgi:alpha-1,2-mannosyltransferase